jgi:DNA repair protein RecO (recombination protein O)
MSPASQAATYNLAMARYQQQPAYVLHGRAYRESSLLLELLTRDHGRTALVARGARAARSRWRNLLQPYRPLLVGWTARGELGTLTAAEQVAAPPALHGEALYCGLYLNELLVRLLHRGDPHPEVFERYRATIAELSTGQMLQPLLRVFERHLLDAVGYGVVLDVDSANGRTIHPAKHYAYRAGAGLFEVTNGPDSGTGAISGAALLALATDQVEPKYYTPLRRLMRQAIQHALGGKPLKSSFLYRSLA